MRDPSYSKRVLWRNVSLCMREKYGRENITRLSKEAQVGPATIHRIKTAETSVGLEVLDRIAAVFELEPWHLLVPSFDPKNPPVVSLSRAEREFYERMKDAANKLINPPKT